MGPTSSNGTPACDAVADELDLMDLVIDQALHHMDWLDRSPGFLVHPNWGSIRKKGSILSLNCQNGLTIHSKAQNMKMVQDVSKKSIIWSFGHLEWIFLLFMCCNGILSLGILLGWDLEWESSLHHNSKSIHHPKF